MDTAVSALQADQQALLAALSSILAPVASLCLDKGVTIQAVEQLVRQAFVAAARQSSPGTNPDRLTSRISTMTGLTRREVDRLAAAPARQPSQTRSAVTELLTHWISQPGYTDADGYPLPIARLGAAPSFEALANMVTKDVHPRSLLAEMIRLDLVAVDAQSDQVALVKSAFVPSGNWSHLVGLLGANVGDHLQAAVDNVLGQGTEHFEQALFADELSLASVQAARPLIARFWRDMMTRLGPQLHALMAADAAAGRPCDQSIKVGLYTWTAPMPPPN
jgi:hypothetical protein